MVRLLGIAALALTVGCSSTSKNSPFTKPELATVTVAPGDGGNRVDVGVDVYSVFQNPADYTWGEWTTLAAAAVGFWYAGEQTDWFGLDEKKDDDPKAFKQQSELLQVPEDPRSFKGALATRQSCQFLGQSTDKVKLSATFGSSGSSTCEIDTNEPEEE